jgi:hypothetical protein
MPTHDRVFIASEIGSFAYKPGEGVQPLFGGRKVSAQSLVSVPWTREKMFLIGSQQRFFLDALDQLRSPKVDDSNPRGPPQVVATLPSINTLLLQYGPDNYRVTASENIERLNRVERSVHAAVDVPWWGRGLLADPDGLKTLDADGRVEQASLIFRGRAIPPPKPRSETVHVGAPFLTVVPVGSRREILVERNRLDVRSALKAPWIGIRENGEAYEIGGLGEEERILAYYDRGPDEDVVLGTTGGLFAVSRDGIGSLVEGSPKTAMRFIQPFSGGVVLVGGYDGLFVFTRERLARVAQPGPFDAIGAVEQFMNVPFASLTLVFGTLGTVAIHRDGAPEVVESLSPESPFVETTVIPDLQAVYAQGNGIKGVLNRGAKLHQLARTGPSRACDHPL